MCPINTIFLNLLHDDYRKYNCFIETGTLNGTTIFSLEPYFNKLYTIEISENYYNNTKNKYNGSKINFILGDSAIVFESLLPTIRDKCIFFLDGHYHGGDSGRSNKDCPLDEEITHINNLFTNDAIIIIDDFRLFGLDKSSGKLGEDWSKINKKNLLNILQGRINKVYHLDSAYAKDDRLIIHINAK
uniref:Methyltransferase n=1 Tax=viral metagenome TaxID=1070528 RepID=A0A6C0ID33_9ZZZZ